MSIYKVHIKTDGNVTTYTTNATLLATITYRAEVGKYNVTTDNWDKSVDTATEAENMVHEIITSLFTNWGITPDFINDYK